MTATMTIQRAEPTTTEKSYVRFSEHFDAHAIHSHGTWWVGLYYRTGDAGTYPCLFSKDGFATDEAAFAQARAHLDTLLEHLLAEIGGER